MLQNASQVNAVQDGRTEEPVVWSSPEKDTLMATMQILSGLGKRNVSNITFCYITRGISVHERK